MRAVDLDAVLSDDVAKLCDSLSLVKCLKTICSSANSISLMS